ncbi:MAG: ATP-binding cassette domain-containing protein [Actinomycetota bacterium]|nr:ATP-binding cassette domain-containing protein [Actinomycetota bacterium]
MQARRDELPPSVDVRDLVVQFRVRAPGVGPRVVVRAVDGVSLRVGRGATVGLVGESGSGKSTFGRALLRLAPASGGSVRIEGEDVLGAGHRELRALRQRAQMVFQNPIGSLNTRMRVGRIVREPLDIQRIGDRVSRRARVRELLDQVGLPRDAEGRYPHELSGGQQQRIALARALASAPSLIICDEPVAALDVSIQAQVLEVLKDVQRATGVSYLFISHDLNVVRHLAHETYVMYLGGVVEHGPSASVFASPRHPYTRGLVAATPVADPERARRSPLLRGEIPSPMEVPPGCRFHTRCPFAEERCREEAPVLGETGDGGRVACHFWRELPREDPRAAPTRGGA